ncbi:choice-of-anchor A family protein [Kitasatospora viridis]|uniref:Choice-of-anchor A domain-containing protein n=1 Tax=Kitasatospora viridis TaxID=281105 RepID=A0A561UDK6_9ACTN|nr:choice-of-anchor A family protein [Kitasatospora viridis]TWF97418.1 choice-of-anchor A domain-containing protein [Kitasatospora viridis]
MRISVPAAALALGGSLALGTLAAPAAFAAQQPACQTQGLGVAGQYGEFIEGNDSHSPDAEGAVAVGGDADFSRGFSVGQELTPAEVAALPGQDALVVGGNIDVGGGNTEVMHGNGVYAGQKSGGGRLEGHAGTVTHGPSPIDFAAEFAKLRALSGTLAGQAAGGTVALNGSTLTLTGTDGSYNGFQLTAAQLQGAKAIQLNVPKGAVTVVTVTGDAYDSQAAGTTSMWIWDHTKNAYVLDDKLQSADGGAERAALLWNFPGAKKFVKNSQLAWAGTILAPNADFDLGTGAPVNGSVIAHSLVGSGGAETHHFPFTACLPVTTPTQPAPQPSASTPGAPQPSTSAPAPVVAPTTGKPSTGTAPSTPATPSTSATTPAAAAPSTAPPPSATPAPHTGGGLAFTGAEGILPLTIGGLLVLAGGGAIVLATRRRAAGRKA